MRHYWKKITSVLLVLLLLSTLLPAIYAQGSARAAESSAQYEQVRVKGLRQYDYAYEVLNLVNAERAKEGLSALTMDKTLTEAAMSRGAEAALLFSHTRPDGTVCFTANDKMFAENIAAGQATPADVMTSWMNSSGHRANIMDSEFKSIGIGCFQINGCYYWVQCFGIDAAVTFSKPSNSTVTETVRLQAGTFPSQTEPGVSYQFFLNLSAGKTDLVPGDAVTVTARIHAGSHSFGSCPVEPDSLRWSASPAGILNVQSNQVKAAGSGTATLTASTTGGLISGNLTFTVTCSHPSSRTVTTEATCTKSGGTRTVCTVCGKTLSESVIPALGHDWDGGTLTVPPTIDAPGAKVFTCQRCGVQKTESVPSNPFVDVAEGKYYYNPVLWAFYHVPQITGGTDDTHFSPGKTCTREQIVTFLWKAMGAPEPVSDSSPFTDVKPGKYYYKAVLWAVEHGITGGVSDNLFGVGRSCTREQAMTFLWKACDTPDHETAESPFTDVTPGKYYYNAILWAVENHITGGVGNGLFGVGRPCTRGQIVSFLYQALGKN